MTSHDRYSHPLSERYASREMQQIFSPRKRFGTWRRLWLALAESEAELGIDPIWFGVFVVMMAELALVTPPIGANVFVMRRTAPEGPMGDIFMGVLPFVGGEMVVIALLIAFPEIALWLPGQMG